MSSLRVLNSGLVDYEEALSQQLLWVNERKKGSFDNIFWLLSHPEVITMGASRSSKDNLIIPTEIPVVKVSRGGDITYHDPGQLTGYFIFNLKEPSSFKSISSSIIRSLYFGSPYGANPINLYSPELTLKPQ